MCRILGSFGEKIVTQEHLANAMNKQLKGGPDAQTIKRGNGWALGHNRLAIQGLRGGHQPFYSNDIYAIYNGEIYNHIALKKELMKESEVVEDPCDGSVIIPLYEKYGEDFVRYLDGMFAIAIIDLRHEKKLILACDATAMKSVYYYEDLVSHSLQFSSELAPLFELPVPKQLRTEAVNEYLMGRSLWHNRTFFENVYSLPPSSILIKKAGKPAIVHQYKSSQVRHFNVHHSFDEASALFHDLLDQEIKQIVQADVPVCLVTSGGLDSSLITVMTAKHIDNLTCFNVAYEGSWPSDERHYAREVSDLHGLTYNQVLIGESEFPFLLNKTIEHLGQPNSAPHALSTYALFKAIHESGFKVAITGEGADEFFGGYDRFKTAMFKSQAPWLDEYFDVMGATTRFMRNKIYSPEYIQQLKNTPTLIEQASQQILNNAISEGRLKALLRFDQQERFPSYILRRVDHLSMANAVEVRIPFCQPKIVSYANSLPDDFLIDRHQVKKILYHIAKAKLPRSILERPKQPFTLPIVAMLKKGHILFDILQETLTSTVFKQRGFFDSRAVNRLIQSQLSKSHADSANTLWSLMILELWLQKHQCSFHL